MTMSRKLKEKMYNIVSKIEELQNKKIHIAGIYKLDNGQIELGYYSQYESTDWLLDLSVNKTKLINRMDILYIFQEYKNIHDRVNMLYHDCMEKLEKEV